MLGPKGPRAHGPLGGPMGPRPWAHRPMGPAPIFPLKEIPMRFESPDPPVDYVDLNGWRSGSKGYPNLSDERESQT